MGGGHIELMTPLKLGNAVVGRRVAAGFCAAALVAALVLYPARARAAATAVAAGLTAVGFGVTVCAFLNAAGIYPFQDSSATFNAWTEGDLSELINQYNATNPDILITPQTIKAYLSGATICVVHNAWVGLRGFALWLRDTFALQDNQEGVQLGASQDSYVLLPIFSSMPNKSTFLSDSALLLDSPPHRYGASVLARACIFGRYNSILGRMVYGAFVVSTVSGIIYSTTDDSYTISSGQTRNSISVDGVTYYYYIGSSGYTLTDFYAPVYEYPGLSERDSCSSAYEEMVRYMYGDSTLSSGVYVDTTSVSVPDALPEDAQFGGLRVAGASGLGVEAVEDIIEGGVIERQQPTVRSVEVTVAEGTEIDVETGAISGTGGVVIDEAEIVPAASVFAIPASLVSDFTYALQHKFPLCIPFDALRIVQAFVKTPSAPEIRLTFTDPFSGTECNFVVSLSPWDDVAAVIRELQSLLLLVGFMLNAPKVLFLRDLLVP